MFRLFLDTSSIVASILPTEEDNKYPMAILLQNKVPLVTNEYVIKELRCVLPKFVENFEMNKILEFIHAKFLVLKTPSKNECRKVRCRDRADSPIIASALKENCVLITEDTHLREDASEYVVALTSQEIVTVLGFGLPTKKKNW
jgi:predicted nucleic acid-binding protein